MKDITIIDLNRAPPRRHGPEMFAPTPKPRDDVSKPRLTVPVGSNRVTIPPGAELQYRSADSGRNWSEWKGLPGRLVELRIAEAKTTRRAMRGKPAPRAGGRRGKKRR